MTIDAVIERARSALTASHIKYLAVTLTPIGAEGHEIDERFIERDMAEFIRWREKHLADLAGELASFELDQLRG